MISGSTNESLDFANVDGVHRDETATGNSGGERKFGGYDSRKCFNCGESGHIKPQCPLLKTERREEQKANIAAKAAASSTGKDDDGGSTTEEEKAADPDGAKSGGGAKTRQKGLLATTVGEASEEQSLASIFSTLTPGDEFFFAMFAMCCTL